MSSGNIDERIVQMTFDNTQFEKGVAQTIKSLDSLKDSMEFDDTRKSLDKLRDSADSFNLSRIADGIDEITSRFTIMGRVIGQVKDQIASLLTGYAKSFTVGQIVPGFEKYADATRYKRTLLAAVSFKNQNKTAEENEKIVQDALDNLNEYSDMTSYSYTEMVNSVGKFVSAGVDISKASEAVKGIGNLTSRSGQDKTQMQSAMYNFAQALSTGSVKLMDWKSIENANLATQEFKSTIIKHAEAMGKLKKVSDGVWKTTSGTKVTVDGFNDTLAKGWFTSEVLIDTLKEYSDTSTELGKASYAAASEAITFKEAIDAVNDAVSTGWSKTFTYVFGDLADATTVWTDFCNAIIEVTGAFDEWRNGILKDWSSVETVITYVNGIAVEEKVSGYTSVMNGLYSIFKSIYGIMLAVKDAFFNIFPDTTLDTLMNASTAFEKWAHDLQINFGVLREFGSVTEEATEDIESFSDAYGSALKRGGKNDKEKIKQMQQALKDAGFGELLGKAGVDGIFGAGTEAAVKAFQKANGLEVTGIFDENTYAAMAESSEEAAKSFENTGNMYGTKSRELRTIIEGVASVAKVLWTVLKGVFGVVGTAYNVVVKPFLSLIWNVAVALGLVTKNSIDAADTVGTIENAFASISTAIESISPSITSAITTIKDFLGLNKDVDESAEGFQTFSEWWKVITNSFKEYKVGEKFAAIWEKIKTIFTGLWGDAKEEGAKVGSFIGTGFQSALSWAAENVPKVIDSIGTAIEWLIDNIINPVIKWAPGAIATVKDFFVNLWTSITGSDTYKAAVKWITDAYKTVKTSLTNFFSFSEDENWLTKIGNFFTGIWDTVKGFFSGTEGNTGSGIFTKIGEFFKNLWASITEIFKGKEAVEKDVKVSTSSSDGGDSWITSIVKVIGNIILGALKLVETVISGLGSMSASDIFNIAKSVIGLLSIFKTTSLISSIADTQKILAKAKLQEAKTAKWEAIGNALKHFSILIGVISASIMALSLVPNVGRGIAIIGGIILFIGAIAVLSGTKLGKGMAENLGELSKTFLRLAGSIFIIAGTMMILSMFSPLDMLKAALNLIIVSDALIIIIAEFTGINKLFKAGNLKYGGFNPTTFLQMAGALAIIAGIALILSMFDPLTILKGVGILAIISVFISAFMLAMSVINNKFGDVGKNASKNLIMIAAAITLLVIPVLILGSMNIGLLAKGIGALAIIMLSLSALLFAISKVTPNWSSVMRTIVVMATVMIMLIGFCHVIKSIPSNIKPGIMLEFAESLALIFGVVGGIIAILSALKVDPVTVAAIGGVLAVIVAALAEVLTLIIGQLLNTIVNAMVELSSSNINKDNIDAVTSCIKSIMDLANALNPLSSADAAFAAATGGKTSFQAFCDSVSSFVTAANEMDTKLQTMSDDLPTRVESAKSAITPIVELSNSLSPLTDADAEFAKYTGGMTKFGAFLGDVSTFVTTVNEVIVPCPALPEGLTTKVQSYTDAVQPIVDLANGIAPLSVAEGIKQIFSEETSFGAFLGDVQTFGSTVTTYLVPMKKLPDNIVDKVTSATNAVQPIADLANKINSEGNSNIIGAAKSIFGTESAFSEFCGDVATFGEAVSLNLVDFPSINETDTTNISSAVDAVQPIVDMANAINGSEGVLGSVARIFGADSAFGGFCGDMKTFADTVNTDLANFPTVEDNLASRISGAVSAVQPIVDMANAINGSEGVLGSVARIFGVKSAFGDFCGDMKTFADTVNTDLSDFPSIDSNIGPNIQNAVDAVQPIITMKTTMEGAKSITSTIADIFGIESPFMVLLGSLGTFGDEVSALANSIGAVDSNSLNNVETSVGVMRSIATFMSDLTTSDEYSSVRDTLSEGFLGLGTSTMEQFLTGVEELVSRIGNIDVESPVKISAIGTLMSGLAAMLTGTGPNAITTDNFLKDFDAEVIGQRIIAAASTIATDVNTATTTLTNSNSSFNAAGTAIGDTLVDAVSTTTTDVSTSGATMAESLISGFKSKNFKSIGSYAVEGLVEGLKSNSDKVKQAGTYLGDIAVKSFSDRLEIKSPSRVFMELGRYTDEGLAKGLTNYSSAVSNAADGVGIEVIDSTRSILSNIANVMNTEMDNEPVIRPVVDLSDVSRSAGTIGSLLSGSRDLSVGMASNLAGIVAGQNQPYQNQNGINTSNSNAYNSTISFAGANFNVRSDADIRNLAIEIANVARRDQQLRGSMG